MRFVLVGPTIEENLSVATLAASLRAASQEAIIVSFIHDDEHRNVARQIVAERPDAVGLSMTFQSRARGFVELARSLRANGFTGHITAGGHYASLAAEPLLRNHDQLDSVLRGEADETIVDFAYALTQGQPLDSIAGIVVRNGDGIVYGPQPTKPAELDRLPLPVRDDPPICQLGIATAPLVASRGCEGKCTFCSIASFGRLSTGPARRQRSVANVAAEMAQLWNERGVRIFVFHDDDFFIGEPAADLARVRALGRAMAAQCLPPVALVVKARPDDIDEPVIEELKRLGLVRVFLGIETHSTAGLRSLGRQIDPEANHRALAILHRAGVFVCSNLLLWEPDSTLDDLRANLELMQTFPEQLFNLARTELYEQAPLTRRQQRRGRLLGNYLGRDYTVTDRRAELAWRLFRVAMGDRCYPLQGVVNGAMALACDARMMCHFYPSEQALRLASQVDELVRKQADSTREWLASIVQYAASAPLGQEPEVLMFALDLARTIRAEDAVLLSEMQAARLMLEQYVAQRKSPSSERQPATQDESLAPAARQSARVAAVAAAASLLGCSRCSGSQPQPGPTVTVPVGSSAPSGTTTSTDDEAPGHAAVNLRIFARTSRWRRCRGGAERVTSFGGQAELRDPAVNARFERIEITDGKVTGLYVSPDGRRANFSYQAGEKKGRQRITAVYRKPGDGQGNIARSHYVYQYGDGKATDGRDPQPEPTCGMICDMAAPPPDSVLSTDGDVVFTHHPRQSVQGWATTFRFGFGLRDSLKGELVGKPEITCSTGQPSSVSEAHSRYRSSPGKTPPPLRDRFQVSFDPRPADGSGRLKAGGHYCTVRYRLRQGTRETTHEGTLHIRIDDNGTVKLGTSADGGAFLSEPPGEVVPGANHPELPLPLRYRVVVSELEKRPDGVVLGVDCPAAYQLGSPTFRWSASVGEIEPLEDGSQALWRYTSDEGPAVAICAVQAKAFDLQIGSFTCG